MGPTAAENAFLRLKRCRIRRKAFGRKFKPAKVGQHYGGALEGFVARVEARRHDRLEPRRPRGQKPAARIFEREALVSAKPERLEDA